MKKIYFIALLGFLTGFPSFFLPHLLYAQSQYTISGFIRDASNGEALIGATVAIGERSGTGTVTNVYGF